MSPQGTRVPSPTTLRLRALHRAFNEHARTCEWALSGRWTLCPECLDLDRDCNAAAFADGTAERMGAQWQ